MNLRRCTPAVLILLGACSSGPDYVRPPPPAGISAPAFKESGLWKPAEPAVIDADGRWWKLYGDAELDALEDSVFRDLLTFMMEDPRNITFCTHLLFCSKNIERVGDHATNIAETVHYLVTGENMPLERPKGGQAKVDGGEPLP